MTKRAIVELEQVEGYCLTLAQLSACTRVRETLIMELVESEILSPVADPQAQWMFQPEDLSRLARACRLMDEFELTPVGLALVFDLLDELRLLRQFAGQNKNGTITGRGFK